MGTKQVLKILESLTGNEFMSELADFFRNIQQWQHKLEIRIGEVHKLLVHPGTHFVLVTGEDLSAPEGSTLTPWCRLKINDPGSNIYDHLDSYERLNGQNIVSVRILYP